MVQSNATICPVCGGQLKYYDDVRRIVRTKNGKSYYATLQRLKCTSCKRVHREIPGFIFPYKQYEAEVIKGVQEGFITPETLGYEDYPCELTMIRWRSQKMQLLL